MCRTTRELLKSKYIFYTPCTCCSVSQRTNITLATRETARDQHEHQVLRDITSRLLDSSPGSAEECVGNEASQVTTSRPAKFHREGLLYPWKQRQNNHNTLDSKKSDKLTDREKQWFVFC